MARPIDNDPDVARTRARWGAVLRDRDVDNAAEAATDLINALRAADERRARKVLAKLGVA